MTAKAKAIIIDLDGTLAGIEHRRHHITDGSKDWPAFFKDMIKDNPNVWCQDLVKAMSKTHQIIYVTGRGAEYESVTRRWLDEHSPVAFWRLFMRPKKNFEKDCVIKEAIYRKYIEPTFDITFCIDDRGQVVDMWRKIGLVCLQCDEGDF